MTNHVSARVAWHMDGWNGHICRNPASNTYCVGPHSYPGTKIAEERILEWEQAHSGRCCSELDNIPPYEMRSIREWYVEGLIHQTLADIMVRSKSEVILANMLAEREIPFRYKVPLFAPDGTFYLPDFTITWGGEAWHWEHLGLLDIDAYRHHWETKQAWYDKFFLGRLVTTREAGTLSKDAETLIEEHFS